MSDPIRIDVWSDVVCPWCYIGKRRMEAGIAAFAHEPGAPPVEVEFHSFELSPETQVDVDGSAVVHLSRSKGIPEAQARAMQEHVAAIAAEVDLAYDFGSLLPTNTLRAHQVLHLANARGAQLQVKERLMRGHFIEGRHVGREADLADLASEAGLDHGEVLEALQEGTYLPAVREDIAQARRLGIRGVPFFVIDQRHAISGAQPAELFTETLAQVKSDRLQARPGA